VGIAFGSKGEVSRRKDLLEENNNNNNNNNNNKSATIKITGPG